MHTLFIRTILATLLMVPLFAAAQDGSEVNPPANAAIMQEYFIDYLTDNGFVPEPDQGLRIEDYVTIRDSAGHPTVGVYIDENGLLTPTPAWHEFNEEYCMHYARYKTPSTNVLQIEVIKTTETDAGMTRSLYNFFARNIDMHTSRLDVAADDTYTVMYDASQDSGGIRNNPDYEAMEMIIPGMLDDLFASSGVTGIADPCGDIRVEHVSGDQIGEDVYFLAGFEGGFGTHLTYTWDFGDGSTPAELDKTPTHVYNEEGTFTVTVTVSGDNVEPMTGTVDVTIGGSYALYFQTTTTGDFPEGLNLRTAVEGEIPIAATEDGTFFGEGMISGTVFEGSIVAQLQQLCTFTLVDGLMRAEVQDLNSPSETVVGLWFDLSGSGDFSGLPGANLNCPSAAGMPMFETAFAGIGKIWWAAFAGIHAVHFNPDNMASMDFTGFSAGSGDVVSSATISDTFVEDGASFNQTTVIEIRKQ